MKTPSSVAAKIAEELMPDTTDLARQVDNKKESQEWCALVAREYLKSEMPHAVRRIRDECAGDTLLQEALEALMVSALVKHVTKAGRAPYYKYWRAIFDCMSIEDALRCVPPMYMGDGHTTIRAWVTAREGVSHAEHRDRCVRELSRALVLKDHCGVSEAPSPWSIVRDNNLSKDDVDVWLQESLEDADADVRIAADWLRHKMLEQMVDR